MSLRSKARSVVIPPPTNGWNTKDPIVNMDQSYALEMENFYPNNGAVELRKGYTKFASGLQIQSTYAGIWSLGSLGRTYLVASGRVVTTDKVFDITSGNAVDISGTPSPPLSNPMIYYQTFMSYLFMTNASNSNVYRWSGTGNIGNSGYEFGGGAITGSPGPMTVYKKRLYVLRLGGIVYYSEVEAITGSMRTFDFTSQFRLGGKGIFIGTVTRAKDFNEDELFCIVSDLGEILLYQGDSPISTTWSLVGKYYTGTPLGPKAFFYVDADLNIITTGGVVSMRAILAGSDFKLSDKIEPEFLKLPLTVLQKEINDIIPNVVGAHYSRGGYALVNIPLNSGLSFPDNYSGYEQWVVNLNTGAWCKFTNQNSTCWIVFDDKLYFGSIDGAVYLADTGDFDEDPDDPGEPIARNIKLRPSYNFFNDPYKIKQFTEVTPYISMSEGLDITMDADTDFANVAATSREVDLTDTSYKLYTPTMGLNGLGHCASIRIDQSVTTKRMSLQAIKVTYNEGDIR